MERSDPAHRWPGAARSLKVCATLYATGPYGVLTVPGEGLFHALEAHSANKPDNNGLAALQNEMRLGVSPQVHLLELLPRFGERQPQARILTLHRTVPKADQLPPMCLWRGLHCQLDELSFLVTYCGVGRYLTRVKTRKRHQTLSETRTLMCSPQVMLETLSR